MHPRRLSIEKIQGAPDRCSFCSMTIQQSAFLGVTIAEPYATICSNCIETLAVLNRLALQYQLVASGGSLETIRLALTKVARSEEASGHAKTAAIYILLLFLRRSISILRGHEANACETIHARLAPPRIAVIGNRAGEVASMLSALSPSAGIPLESMTVNGDAELHLQWLRQKCNRDALLFQHGLLLVIDGYLMVDATCGVVWCCNEPVEFPLDVRVIDLNGWSEVHDR
jgi:hypothetical protein